MVIQIQTHDGHEVKTRTYDKVYRGEGLTKLAEGFWAGRDMHRWGVMVQLKGKERIVLHRYGKQDERASILSCSAHDMYKLNCPGCYQANAPMVEQKPKSQWQINKERAQVIIDNLDKGIDIKKLNVERPEVLRLVRWHISDTLQLAEKQLGELDYAMIEASTDYEALIKNSRKKFNDFDIVALQAMRDDEYSYYASHFVSQYKTATGRDDYHDMDAKRRLRRMQRMGLVRLARGLFDEDGFTAGSGWTREYSKNSIIERIIENYTAKNKQLSLADL